MVSYRLLLVVMLCLATAVVRGDEVRTWTDTSGRKVEAKLVRVDSDEVVLDKGGTKLTVPLERFSAADQQYLREKDGGKDAATNNQSGSSPTRSASKAPHSKAAEAVAELKRVREWSDTSGQTIKARFERFFGRQVVLLQGNKARRIDFTSLSAADQDFLRQNFEAQGKADQLPRAMAATSAREGGGAGPGLNQYAGGPGGGMSGGIGRPPSAQPNTAPMPDFDRAQEVLNRWANQNQNEQMRSHLDQARSRLEQMRAEAAARREEMAKSRSAMAAARPSSPPSQPGYGAPSSSYGQPSSTYGQPLSAYGRPTPTHSQPSTGYGQPSPDNAVASAAPPSVSPHFAASSAAPGGDSLYRPPAFTSPAATPSSGDPGSPQAYTPPTGADSSSPAPSMPDMFAASPNMQYQEVIICSQCNKAQRPGFKAGQRCQHCGVTIDEITDESGEVVERSTRSTGKQIKFWVWAGITIIGIIGGVIAKLKG